MKTSILLLDKKLARTAKEILFLKITADGFDLGDKRKSHRGERPAGSGARGEGVAQSNDECGIPNDGRQRHDVGDG